MSRTIYLPAITVCIICCAKATAQVATSTDLDRLATWITGTFSSAEQAQSDTDFFDIRLQIVRIWPQRTDGYWLYVEQATAAAQEKPYRQRVYHLHQLSSDLFESRVFTLNQPEAFINGFKRPDGLTSLSLDSLTLRNGCSIILRKMGDSSFVGTTIANGCESSLRGASYATSVVELSAEQLISWDRGFDNTGKQVWGATKGGYVFRKTSP